MRIAITHAYSWPQVRRGAERMIRALAAALVDRGHDVTVLTAGEPLGWSTEGGARVHRSPRRGSPARHERIFGLRLLSRLTRGRFDAVHSFGPRDAAAAIRSARRGRHRTVYTNLGLPLRTWWAAQPDGAAHDRVTRDVDVYGCMSRFALDMLRTEYGREGVLTPGGVDLAQFTPRDREQQPTILFSGAVAEPRKGVADLLAAVPLLVTEHPTLQVWLSGPGDAGPLLDGAPPEARAHTTVLPLGTPEDQPDRYGRAWVTALPSRWDSFGMALLESLACGTPIVAGNHAAPPELVDQGRTGAICEPGDPASIADALRLAIALAQSPTTATACRGAAEPYDWSALAARFEALYAG